VAARRGSTCGWLLSTRETVAVETPAARATSTMVVTVAPCYSRFTHGSSRPDQGSRGCSRPDGLDTSPCFCTRLPAQAPGTAVVALAAARLIGLPLAGEVAGQKERRTGRRVLESTASPTGHGGLGWQGPFETSPSECVFPLPCLLTLRWCRSGSCTRVL
jgi:hypothetical protein